MGDQTTIESPYMDTEQAARYLGLSKITLQQWRVAGIGPAYSKGGRVKYHKDDLDKYMRSRRTVPEFAKEVA